MSSITEKYRNAIILYKQMLHIANQVNTFEIANISLQYDTQLIRNNINKIISKLEIQSEINKKELCKRIWSAPVVAPNSTALITSHIPTVVPTVVPNITPPVTPIMSYAIPTIVQFIPILAHTSQFIMPEHTPVSYGPIDKKKVVIPNSYTHHIIYFTDNYGVEWRPITKKSTNIYNITKLIQNNIVFCHHKITKELFKLLIGKYTLFLTIDHQVYYHNSKTNSIEKLKNKHGKFAATTVKWISALKKNNTYMQGYLNRSESCVVTQENYKSLSIQNYILF